VKKTPPKMVNQRLAAAMSHPTRSDAFTVLSDREASPKEIAAELGEPINNVTYHVKKLVEFGCVEAVRDVPVKGGRVVEHFYRASRAGWIDEEEWANLGPTERNAVSTTIMRAISSDLSEAMAAGTFFVTDDKHLSRTPMLVDEAGWDEVKLLLHETMTSLLDIRVRAAERSESSDEDETFPIKVDILQFRSPKRLD
jgi:DNA-binding transcriptional ArsR family regulator